jgi:hypothetical protein
MFNTLHTDVYKNNADLCKKYSKYRELTNDNGINDSQECKRLINDKNSKIEENINYRNLLILDYDYDDNIPKDIDDDPEEKKTEDKKLDNNKDTIPKDKELIIKNEQKHEDNQKLKDVKLTIRYGYETEDIIHETTNNLTYDDIDMLVINKKFIGDLGFTITNLIQLANTRIKLINLILLIKNCIIRVYHDNTGTDSYFTYTGNDIIKWKGIFNNYKYIDAETNNIINLGNYLSTIQERYTLGVFSESEIPKIPQMPKILKNPTTKDPKPIIIPNYNNIVREIEYIDDNNKKDPCTYKLKESSLDIFKCNLNCKLIYIYLEYKFITEKITQCRTGSDLSNEYKKWKAFYTKVLSENIDILKTYTLLYHKITDDKIKMSAMLTKEISVKNSDTMTVPFYRIETSKDSGRWNISKTTYFTEIIYNK